MIFYLTKHANELKDRTSILKKKFISQGFKISTNPDLVTAMCMGTDVCWPHVLTCHRWMVNISSPTLAATGANNEVIVP